MGGVLHCVLGLCRCDLAVVNRRSEERSIGLAAAARLWDRLLWARVTDVAKRRRQGLVVCRAALPFEG
jgi:hypothetical protein